MRGASTIDTGDVPAVPQMILLKWLWDRVKHHKKKMSVNFANGFFKCWVCDTRGKNIYRIVRKFGNYQQRQRWLELDGRLDLADFDKIYKEVNDIKNLLDTKLELIPNIPHSNVPVGKDESSNVIIREWGEPKNVEYKLKSHVDLGTSLELFDLERGSKISVEGAVLR